MRVKNNENYGIIRDFTNGYFTAYGKSPSTEEISRGTHIPRPTVQRYLADMRDRGEIEYSGRRGIATELTKELDPSNFTRVGVVGEIACGTPAFAQENIETYIRLPLSLVGDGTYFFLRAHGDSMTDIGIDDGDLVLVRKQETAEAGQVAVLLIGEETTLKRYYPEPKNKRVRLHPENDTMKDFFVTDCSVQGIAVKVLKSIK